MSIFYMDCRIFTETLREAIALAIAVPAIIVGIYKIYKAINNARYRKYPFNMWYQKELKYQDKPILDECKVIPLGETNFILRIQPKRPTEFNDIHVRLVDEESWKSTFPARSRIGVKDLRGEGLLGNNHLVDKTKDNTNGLQARYQRIYHRAPEEALLLIVTVIASADWSGYIVFRAKREDGHQGDDYLPIKAGSK